MERDRLICVLIFTVISLTCAKNTYVVMFPKSIRPGIETGIYVNLLETTNPATVTVTLQDEKNNTITSSSKDNIAVGSPVTIPLTVPNNLTAVQRYAIKVEGNNGITFTNWSQVDFNAKSMSILIQTDKAIYKPGQTIKFRILGMYPDLSIVKESLDIDIYDPKGNKIAQWNGVNDPTGVFGDQLVMSDHPVLGDWKIKVSQGAASEEKTFTVDEYVLPKFEVTVELPPFALTNDLAFHGTVKAKYTFGKPVSGNAKLRIKKKYQYRHWNWREEPQMNNVDSIEQAFPIDGESKFTITAQQLKKLQHDLSGAEFIVEANVTEGVTGLMMKDSDEIRFYDSPAQIEFVSSLPNNYKPGLTYTALLKVTQPDGTPVVNPSSRVKVETNYNVEVATTSTSTTTTTTTTTPTPLEEDVNGTLIEEPMIIPEIIGPRWPRFPKTEKVDLPEQFFDIPPDGVVKFDLEIPSNAVSFEIKGSYMKETAFKYIQPFKSPSSNFIQIRLITEKPVAGENVTVDIKTTEVSEKVYYQIISKGNIVKTGECIMGEMLQKAFTIPITYDMAPKARMIVHYVRTDGEIVSDGVTFSVDGTFKNKVAMNFMTDEALPGSRMLVDLKADPNSQINVLAVDKSVLLLKTGNDITEKEITEELQSYDNSNGGFYPYYASMWYWPSTGRDASDVFDNNGMVVLTDALLYSYVEPFRPVMFRRGGPMAVAFAMNGMVDSPPMMAEMARPDAGSLKPVQKVRKIFPETWLWQNMSSGESGHTTLNVQVPDTITSWVATAFAVSPETGLGLTPQPANLNVFMPFFIQLVLPYSVVRGELIVLQVNIHNYLPRSEWVLVILEQNNGMNNVITYSNGVRKRAHAKVGRWIKLQKGGIGSAFFPIVPKEVGQLKIAVKARTASASDAVEKNLLVEPSGTPQEYNVPVLVDLKTVSTFTRKVNISFPEKTSPGSRRITASVIGDLMGPSINGLDKLIKMPYGCGEQNMLNFAPNIFVRKYLSVTNNLKSDMDAKSKEYMIKGYQRELTYQHKDGSFSAFGESDLSGTTWLTSFVVKSFAQAKQYIFIDDQLVLKAIDWLVSQQEETIGTFREPGKVLHKAMQGGSAAGERSLTAFVLIAMKEADVIPGASDRTSRAIQRATVFLEGEADKLIDTYEMAIVAYALKLVNSPKSEVILERLETLAVSEDGTKHWQHDAKEKPANKYIGWSPPQSQSNAIDIELTSYILLNYAINNNVNSGLPVLRWLTTQRNPDGGFSSTQDTIIALQALAEFAGEIYSSDFNMRITIQSSKGEPFVESYTVTPNNALVLKTFDIPTAVEEITVLANGKGVALAEIAVNFHTDDDIKASSFDVNTTLTEETTNGFRLEVCGRWTKPGETGMAIVEIGIPSGMTPDLESLDFSKSTEFKRKEELYRKLVLYYDKIDENPQCVSLNMMRVDRVAEQQPSPVRIYDYYEPSNQKTTFYSSTLLSKSSLCDVCGKECFC